MRKLIVWTLCGLLAGAAPAGAQSTNFGLGAFAGVSVPIGEFGNTTGAEAGEAELGFVGGLDLFYPLGTFGLTWLTTASVTAHSVDEDAGGGGEGGYLFIPVLTGLRYDIAAGLIDVFLTGQGGAVFHKGPSLQGPLGDADADWGTAFGLGVGAGLQVTDNLYAGIKYFPLGDVDFSFEDTDESFPQDVSFLEVFVGFGVR
jgi:opacity protein-like surface antigen